LFVTFIFDLGLWPEALAGGGAQETMSADDAMVRMMK